MTAGFNEQRRMNPRALTAVTLLHGAALTALLLAKGETIDRMIRTPTEVELIDETKPPPEKPRPPEKAQPRQKSVVDIPKTLVPTPQPPVFFDTTPLPHIPEPVPPTPTDLLPPPPPPPPPPARTVEPARAKANLGSYVSDADYPSSAIRAEEQGTTRFRLSVTPDGRVSECVVIGSSGSQALDTATCRLMKSRARFSPARDSSGNPTGDSVSSAIRWVLPDQ